MKNFFVFKMIFLISINCFFFNIHALEDSLFKPKNEDESLFLRRVAEFWQDGEMEIAKFQIENFITNNPNSTLVDPLYALLGNLFMNEKDYSKAISYFDNIKTEEVKDKIIINLLASLYNMKWYQRLIDDCEIYSKKTDGELKQKIIYLQALSLYNKASDTTDKTENENLITKAKNKFEELLESQFSTQAKEYLSQIHKSLNEFEKASTYFLQLAEKDLTKEDDYLFQAALMQARFDKEKALNTFNKITQLSSSKIPEATFNKLLLLFEMQKFDDIINQKDTFLQKVASEKLPLTNFFIGKSFFKNKNYESASKYLEDSLKIEDRSSEQLKLAHIMLMQSCYHSNNYDLFNKTFESFKTLYPQDDQIFECHFAKALLNKNNCRYEAAKDEFEKISNTIDKSKLNEKFLYEYAQLLFLIGDTQNSKLKFKEFLEKYPNHELVKSSLIFIVNCSIKELQKKLTSEEIVTIKKTLVSEIESLLQKENIFTKKEKLEYNFLLSKTHFDLSNYDKCLNLAENLIKEDSEELSINNQSLLTKEDLSEIYLLIGFCHKYIHENINEFIHYAQKSLELSSNPKNYFSTYVNLFNSYLTLSKEKDSINESHLEKAANYLFSAYELSPNEINKTNLIWLTNYYLIKVKTYLNENYKNKVESNSQTAKYCNNATSILKSIITNPEDYLEEFTNKLAYLYHIQNNLQEEQIILENLVQDYRFHPDKIYKYFEETIFNLANNYESQNKNEKAIALYFEFLPSFKKESPFKPSCMLHSSRLQLVSISKENLTSTNKDLEKIISTLKTISLQRNLENEPVHLEAALDYVDVVCYMEKNDSWEKRLFLLSRLKENFNSQEDVMSQDYKTMRGLLKDKDAIFNAYMNLVDAEKFICLGFVEKNVNQIKQAKETLQKMNDNHLIINSYLENRVLKDMKIVEDFKVEEK
jgi:tetratricopeptide (TPR) repeat protein